MFGEQKTAFGFSLNYFNSANGGDYKPIGTTVTPFAEVTELLPAMADGVQTGRNLYNGNIRAMVVNISQLGNGGVYGYRYDQLNRIKAMNSFSGFTNATNTLTAAPLDDYKERISYDPNGNIKTYLRNGDAAGLTMDNMTYTYKTTNNQLDRVADAAADASLAQYPNYNDIKQGQATGNYQYDAIGNLISDAAEGITNISWTVYGKIQSITKTINAVTTVINYGYDASGNRISKAVTVGGTTANTIYVRDASGNTMAVYTKDAAINSGAFTQTEISLYGSSRLGVWNINRNLSTLTSIDYSNYRGSFTRGNKLFELANHLGNVLVTVSDKKIGVDVAPQNGIIDYSVAEVVTANDYYPFGMAMPGRKYSSSSSKYRYGFNTQENSTEINDNSYTTEFWQYDSRIGRRWNVDPIKNIAESQYACFGDNPIYYGDPLGDFKTKFGAKWYKFWHGSGGDVRQNTTEGSQRNGEWYIQKEGETGKKGNGKQNLDEVIVYNPIYGSRSVEVVDNITYKVASVWNSFDFVATGTAKVTIGVQLEAKVVGKVLGYGVKGKVGGGIYVNELVTVTGGWEGKIICDTEKGHQIIHNYIMGEVGLETPTTKFVGVGIKYDYNYDYYNSYSHGPTKVGDARHDWALYTITKSLGNKAKSLDNFFNPLSNPFTPKAKMGGAEKGEKTFVGLDLGGSIKVLLGVEYSLNLGINY